MAKYRKRPVVIEAEQFTPDCVQHDKQGKLLLDALPAGLVEGSNGGFVCNTLEGPLHASFGDWIICGVKGEYYPCKPDVFAETYEPAARAQQPAQLSKDNG